ncbi:hypothetical protein [Corallibacter sp.]|uniref:hypothetical protein n=1 Tax=Corallibacter sp. TaxID=2038084 RepID=UPI003AB66AB8
MLGIFSLFTNCERDFDNIPITSNTSQSNSAINDIELVVTGTYFDIPEEGASTVPTIPYGEYRLIKQ